MNDELWAVFVQATEIHSFVENIDASDALVSKKSNLSVSLHCNVAKVSSEFLQYFRCTMEWLHVN